MIMNQMIAGAKTVTGEIALSNSAFLEVTGLSFRPKGIMAAANQIPTGERDIVWYLADQNTGTSLGLTKESNLTNATLTITSNSIKISDAISSSGGQRDFHGTYRYIVWG